VDQLVEGGIASGKNYCPFQRFWLKRAVDFYEIWVRLNFGVNDVLESLLDRQGVGVA
jgi:hypothetical protein